MPGLVERLKRRLPLGRRRGPDPFVVLELQMRLSRLAAELDQLDRERVPRFALAHHAEATTRAYERTLLDACALVGLPLPEEPHRPTRMLLLEAELAQAGWSW